jgi:tRNA pseudouridine55 synthase
MPWTSTRILTDQEVGSLRQGQAIPQGELLPPEWQVPTGFPPPEPLVRALHLDRFRFLLRPERDQLTVVSELGTGI